MLDDSREIYKLKHDERFYGAKRSLRALVNNICSLENKSSTADVATGADDERYSQPIDCNAKAINRIPDNAASAVFRALAGRAPTRTHNQASEID